MPTLYFKGKTFVQNHQVPYQLTEFEKNIIAESQAQYQSGEVINNDEVISRNEEWLKE
jgi:hypothetical protein